MSGTPLDDARYISLRSYRRDGSPVDTPIWQAPLAGKLVGYTSGSSYKVKRIRRDARVQVARCSFRGRILSPWRSGRCEIAEQGSDLERAAYRALYRKYGLQVRIGVAVSIVTGKRKDRVVLVITLDDETAVDVGRQDGPVTTEARGG